MEYQRYSLQLLSGQRPIVVSNRVHTKVDLSDKRTIACEFHAFSVIAEDLNYFASSGAEFS
jgi:hypothetical protein